jgi:hypothetical protein
MRRLWLAAVLLLTSVGAANANVVMIDNDYGGLINVYLKKYDVIRDERMPVVIKGDCVSACTLVLTLPHWQVCAEPNSRLGFHGASMKPGGPLAPKATQMFASLYPPSVPRRWFKTTVVHYVPAKAFIKPCHR